MGRNYIAERASSAAYKAATAGARQRNDRHDAYWRTMARNAYEIGKLRENAPMPNHPNRSKSNPSPSRNPSPDEVRAAREAAGLTQTEAAAMVHTTLRAWQQWEAEPGTPGHRNMHPAFWELFTIKTMGIKP